MTSSVYPPAQNQRIEFVSNAGIRITTVKETDEETIVLYADYGLDRSEGKTELNVIVSPKSSGTELTGSTTATKGDATLELVCGVESRPSANITWYKDGIALVHDATKITISEATTSGLDCDSVINTSTLTIATIDENDSGTITCTSFMMTDQLIQHNQTTNLIVQYGPGTVQNSTISFSQNDINAGATVTITCQGYAMPSPTYEIQFDGNTIATGGGNNQPFSHNVGPVASHDDGTYSCVITNAAGNETMEANLTVNVEPKVWYFTGVTNEVLDGAAVNITCSMFADPFVEANLIWTKDTGASTFTETKVTVFSNATIQYISNSMEITSAVKADYGGYKCTGTNGVGKTVQSMTLMIQCPPTITQTSFPSTTSFATEESYINLQCTVKGYPKPDIIWSINGTIINVDVQTDTENLQAGIWVVDQQARYKVYRNDSGTILCIGDNGILPNVNRSSQLVVNYIPTTTLSVYNKTTFDLNGQETFQAQTGDTIHLLCETNGMPQPSVTWLRDGVDVTSELTTNQTVISTDYVITVQAWAELPIVDDSNVKNLYGCRTHNSVGTTENLIQMLTLYGEFTKKPVNATCGAIGFATFLDWQYTYSQPLDFITWSKYYPKDTIGSLSNATGSLVKNKRVGYDNDGTTLSGLYIQNTQFSDEGLYEILINFKNSATVLTDIVYVLVISNPHHTTITPGNPNVVEGSNVSITCQSVGKPAPDLKWFKGSDLVSELGNDTDYTVTTLERVNGDEFLSQSVLTIHEASFTDIADYTCHAGGKLGNETKVARLVLFYYPRNTTLTANSNPITAKEELTLTCTSVGNPSSIYYEYYFNGSLIQNSTSQTYSIPSVDNWHGGEYTCQAVNWVGNGSIDTLTLDVQVPPYIYEYNHPVYVEDGKDASLICKAYGNPKPEIYWEKVAGGTGDRLTPTTIDGNANTTLFSRDSTGAITSVTTDDPGVYLCYANSTLGFDAKNITVSIQYAPVITNSTLLQPSENFTATNRTIEWCIAEGFPQPLIQWRLNDIALTRHDVTLEVISVTTNLITVKSTIEMSLDHNDNGVFTCHASNNIGFDVNSTNLEVLYPPIITGHPNVIEAADLTGSLTLSCVAKSKEIAIITWYKDDVLVTAGGTKDIQENIKLSIDQKTSTLSINDVSDSTFGRYRCEANNSLGSVYDDTTVNVFESVKIREFSPSTLTVSENFKNLIIPCVADGVPRPTITWYFDNTLITFPDAKYDLTVGTNLTHVSNYLSINTVTTNEYGQYKCLARNVNSVGTAKTDQEVTTLTVQHDPFFLTGTPQTTYNVNIYENVTLTCRVQSYPTSKIYWIIPSGVTKDERSSIEETTLTSTIQTVVKESNLTITNVSNLDYGSYQCYANNSFNFVTMNSLLNVYYPPSENTSTIVYIKEGIDNLSLQPSIASNPAVATPTYTFNGNPITDAKYTLSSTVTGDAPTGGVIQQPHIFASQTTQSMSGDYLIRTCNMLGCRDDEYKVIVQYAPVLTSSTNNVHLNKTNQLLLTCTFDTNPTSTPALVTWKHGSTILTNGNNGFTISEVPNVINNLKTSVTSTLSLNRVDVVNKGEYTCQATNIVGSNEKVIRVTVCYPPVYTTDLSNTIIRLSQGSPLRVETSASPQATYKWYKNDVLMSPSVSTNNVVSNVFDEYIQNSGITATESGVYQVITCNSYGCTNSSQTTIVVEFKPVVTSFPDVTVTENNTATMTCVVDSEPQVTSIEWYLNGTKITSNSRQTISSTTHAQLTYKTTSTSTYTVTDAQRDLHAGIYTCKGTNSVGTSEDTANLFVRYPVVLITDVKNITVAEGSDLILSMYVNSYPDVSFSWRTCADNQFVDDIFTQRYSYTRPQAIFDVFKNETLTLSGSEVVRTRAGWYCVKADNNIGRFLTSSAYVDVIWKPDFLITPTSKNATLGTTESLKCQVRSYPIATIQWIKGGNTVLPSTQRTISAADAKESVVESELTLTNLGSNDYSNYTCQAVNTAGTSQANALLNVFFKPILVATNSSIEVERGSSMTLNCANNANPTAVCQWTKDTQSFVYNDCSFTTTVQIASEGVYSCTPTNALGSGNTVFHQVTVIAPPTVTVRAVCAHTNGVTKCQCNGTGYPKPSIYWYKHPYNSKLTEGSTLTVAHDSRSDGTYICYINNTVGAQQSAAPLALFVSSGQLTGNWGEWGACEPKCSNNSLSERRRKCELLDEKECYDALVESKTCIAECEGSVIPTMDGAEDDGMIALYVLLPIALVGLTLWAAWFANSPSASPAIMTVPVNSALASGPPINSIPRDMESIEVNLLFEDDDGNQMEPVSPATTGTLTSEDYNPDDDDEEDYQVLPSATEYDNP